MKRVITLPAIKANASVGYRYYQNLLGLVQAMNSDMRKAVLDTFTTTDNVDTIIGAMNIRALEWQNFIDRKSDMIASQFVSNVDRATTTSLAHSLRKAPKPIAEALVVKLNNHGKQALNANKLAVVENVSLIKSIPAKYHDQITFLVTEAVGQSRGRKWLEDEIIQLGHSTKDRAKLIAKDQLNKVTEIINVSRQKGLGITHNKWHHSSRPKQPRQSHIKADGKIYPLDKGCLIDGEYLFPAQAINCYCYSSPVIIFDDGVE